MQDNKNERINFLPKPVLVLSFSLILFTSSLTTPSHNFLVLLLEEEEEEEQEPSRLKGGAGVMNCHL